MRKETLNKNQSKEKGYKNLLKILPFYKKFWKLVLAIVAIALISAGVATLKPIYTGKLVSSFTNIITTNLNFNEILRLSVITLAVVVGQQLINFVWGFLAVKLFGKVKFDLKHKMLSKVIDITPKNFDTVNSGTFISRLNKDATELSDIFNRIADFISDIISNFAFIIYVFFINVYMGLFLVAYMVIIFVIEKYRLTYRFRYRRLWKEKDEKVVGSYNEIVRGVRDVKCLNIKDNTIEIADGFLNDEIKTEYKGNLVNNLWNRSRRITNGLLDFLFIMVSVLLIVKSNFTVEGFLIVLMYKGNILNFINFVINITEILKEGELSALRVFEVIEDDVFEKETFGDKVVENVKGNIEFKNVDFKYNNDDKNLLFKNLSFKIKENSVVAIVGKSGQGKTTILNLINKMYPIEEKRNSGIFIDDHNINDLTKESLRSNITVVPQNPYIFNLTIKENLQIVKKDATMEEIIDVCKKAQIYDFIMSKEKNFDSIVGENGIVLSGGQKQRLAIARALLKNSKIILLDEATSSLDNESQSKIKKVIKTLSKTHTILVVAHRLSTVVDCDKILYLENNKIVDEGTHEYLMSNVEGYKQLYMEEEQK